MKLIGTLLAITNVLAVVLATTTPKPTTTTKPATTTTVPPALPIWSKEYYAKGTIKLPYVPITEPFEAYIDKSKPEDGKSRIDYYGGITKTIQFDVSSEGGKYGDLYKISPQTTETMWNEKQCFHTPGYHDMPAKAQDVLPDLTGFFYLGLETAENTVCTDAKQCEKWFTEDTSYPNKVSNYTLWVQRDANGGAVPVRYQMMGYNSLFGSHYDHYIVEYETYTPGPQDPKLFNATAQLNKACHGFPGPGIRHHTYTFNPMAEFIHRETKHVDEAFDDFVSTHNKEYSHDHEKDAKKDVFRQNMRFIHSVNRQNLSYKLAPNHLTDTTQEERRFMTGRFRSGSESIHGSHLRSQARSFQYTQQDVDDLPEEKNWVKEGAVNPPKDQAICGSCWSFGTTGTLEGSYFVKTNKLVKFSEQALIDCSWGEGNNGCDGGEEWRAFEWMQKHGGIPTDETYGTYMGIDGNCHFNDTNIDIKFAIDHYVNVTSKDQNALKVALNQNGPIAVDIDAAHPSLAFYSGGLWHDSDCTPDTLDHAVLLVGYGTEWNGKGYWLIKNSWSSYWGVDGYVKIAMEPNDCGVATSPSYAVLKDSSTTTAAPTTTAGNGSQQDYPSKILLALLASCLIYYVK